MTTQENAIKTAKGLFNVDNLTNVGNGFYRYVEPIKDEMISRKGLEREVSAYLKKPYTIITRNTDEDSRTAYARNRAYNEPATNRITILQPLAEYEAERGKIMEAKTRKLQEKFNS